MVSELKIAELTNILDIIVFGVGMVVGVASTLFYIVQNILSSDQVENLVLEPSPQQSSTLLALIITSFIGGTLILTSSIVKNCSYVKHQQNGAIPQNSVAEIGI